MTTEEIVETLGALAYESGRRQGRLDEQQDSKREFAAIAARIRTTKTRIDVVAWEQASVNGLPCGLRCGRCSTCIRAAAVARRGGDYCGGPVAWEAE
jgi:hypothetical protein